MKIQVWQNANRENAKPEFFYSIIFRAKPASKRHHCEKRETEMPVRAEHPQRNTATQIAAQHICAKYERKTLAPNRLDALFRCTD